MTFDDSLTLELIKSAVAIIILLATWAIGQRILVSWDLKKKRQESDLAAAVEFNAIYGEFKDVSKLWRVLMRNVDAKLVPPEHTPWELLRRACGIESRAEALLVKLATERVLSEKDVSTLGLFRQAVQQLREAIRDGEPLSSSSRGPDYAFFNVLTAKVSCIIASKHPMRRLTAAEAERNLQSVASITGTDYLDARPREE